MLWSEIVSDIPSSKDINRGRWSGRIETGPNTLRCDERTDRSVPLEKHPCTNIYNALYTKADKGFMINSGPRLWIALWLGLLSATTGSSAVLAADCPGHPDALGTSRTLVVDPREHPHIGSMQYQETLPLRDHEVVLTFDDGPLPKYSNQVLRILADECIKATFFVIGSQVKANPEGVRKLVAAGHTVGTHSQNHPLTFKRMPIEKAEAEINAGIASTTAAMTDPSALAPFFRIPGLERSTVVEDYLASRGIQVWSADFPADDWRHISPDRVYQLAIQRLEAKHKGVLLLHDIQQRTTLALPKIIRDLKARGYHIVHVVPATADQPATPTKPSEWQSHPQPEQPLIAYVPNLTEMLPVPAPINLNVGLPQAGHRITGQAGAVVLPVASRELFEIKKESLAQRTTHFRHATTRANARLAWARPIHIVRATRAAKRSVRSFGRAPLRPYQSASPRV